MGQKQKHRMPMLIWFASQPFYHVSCDILGPVPIRKGHKNIFMTGDNFSQWFEATTLQDIKSITACDALNDASIARFGVPGNIGSENGVQFTSKFINIFVISWEWSQITRQPIIHRVTVKLSESIEH